MRLVGLILCFLATILVASSHDLSFQTNPLRMKTDSSSSSFNCPSWRVGVEAHNIIDWTTVPEECEDYVKNYILGDQYSEDSKAVTHEAYLYAKSLNLSGNGKDIWVFDIDETILSNVPFFADHRFGVEPFDGEAFGEWVNEGKAERLNESYALYEKLLDLGIKVVFITGRIEFVHRNITIKNLNSVGYYTWEKLILRDVSEYGNNTSSQTYKSSERMKLEKEGYRIVGNMGDQWSDILGTNTGYRTFKLPNPMIYFS